MTNSIQSPITEVNLSLNRLTSADGRELTDAKEYLAIFRILPLFLLNSYGVKVEPTEGELYKLINNHLLTFIGISRWGRAEIHVETCHISLKPLIYIWFKIRLSHRLLMSDNVFGKR